MWHFDIYHAIYSDELKRRISIVTHDERWFTGKRFKTTRIYTLVEEWYAPNSKGDTGDFDHYTFMTYQDAAVFIAQLAKKLNTWQQWYLMRAAEVYATRITQDYKEAFKQLNAEIATELKTQQQKKEIVHSKNVYIFLLEDERIKIGVSNDVKRRRQDIMQGSGLNILTWCHTEPQPESKAFEIESDCHRHFKEYHTRGEFFKAPFDEACVYLQSLVKKPLVMCRKEKT